MIIYSCIVQRNWDFGDIKWLMEAIIGLFGQSRILDLLQQALFTKLSLNFSLAGLS